MIWNYLKYVAVATILTMSGYTPAEAAGSIPDKPKNASVSLGGEFASGSYGTDSTIRSVYMPLIATWSPTDRFDIGIEVPFIYQSSSHVTTDLYRTSQSTTAAKTTSKGGPGGNRGNGSSGSDVFGLGDIILRLGAVALRESTTVPQLRSSLFIKCPTANGSDGLGTGEFDIGIGVEASKWYGAMHLIGEGFYTYQGKVAGFDLKDYFSFTTGLGYQLTNNVEPMLIVKGATAPTSFSGGLLEVRARVIWSLTGTTSLDLYGARGIADSSPDYGGGLSVIYSF